MAEETRASQFLSDHLYIYTDDPQHILLDIDGKPQEARFQQSTVLKQVLTNQELGAIVSLRQALMRFENAQDNDEALTVTLIELFPTLGNYENIIPKKSQQLHDKSLKETGGVGRDKPKEEPAKEETGDSTGSKTPAKATKKQTDWIETMLHNRQLTVQEVGKPLSELTSAEASKLIELGKGRPVKKAEDKGQTPAKQTSPQKETEQKMTAREAYQFKEPPAVKTEYVSEPVNPAIRQEHGLVIPDVDQAVEVMKAFQDMKARLLDKDDIATISGRTYAKKSGCRKYALAFRISLRTVRIEREYDPNGDKIARVFAQAVMPDGVVIDGYGVCDSATVRTSKMPDTWHNVESKAQTRAYNRATLDAIGGGEVSADEIQ